LLQGNTGWKAYPSTSDIVNVGELIRVETPELIVGYEFDLTTNTLSAQTIPNPSAGKIHRFVAYRVKTEPGTSVSMNISNPSS
jgi:hypothetical protein